MPQNVVPTTSPSPHGKTPSRQKGLSTIFGGLGQKKRKSRGEPDSIASKPTEPECKQTSDTEDQPQGSTSAGRRLAAEMEYERAAEHLRSQISGLNMVHELPTAMKLQDHEKIDDVRDTSRSLQAALEKLLNSRVELSTPCRIQIVTGFVGRWFNTLYPFVKPCLGITADCLPGPFGLVPTGIIVLLKTAYEAKKRRDDVEATISFLSESLNDVQVTEGFSDVLTDDKMEDVYCAALEVATTSTKYLSLAITFFKDKSIGNTIRNLWDGDEKFSAAKGAVKASLQKYSASMGYLTAKMGCMLLHDSQMRKRKDILKWLQDDDPLSRHWEIHSRRVEHTGGWFLETISEWMKGNNASPMMCIGDAGSGKSFLASLLVDRLFLHTNNLNPTKIAVVAFYFDCTNATRRSARSVALGLLKQILYQSDTIPHQVEECYDQNEMLGSQAKPDMKQLLSLFIRCAESFSRVFVILDAFDEALETERHLVSDYLQSLAAIDRMRILVFSRPNPIILKDLEEKMCIDRRDFVNVMATSEDVETFISYTLEEKRKLGNPAHRIKDRIVQVITKDLEGKFLLADVQLAHVLNQIEIPNIEAALETIPIDLRAAYTAILQRIAAREEGVYNLALRTLSWLFYAARPLKRAEFLELLFFRIGHVQIEEQHQLPDDRVLDVCESLVTYDEESEAFRFSHYTVKEFLERHLTSMLMSASKIGETCLAYLLLEEFASGPAEDMSQLEARCVKFKALRYVAQFWDHHVNMENTHFVQDIAINFLSDEAKRNNMLQLRELESDNIEDMPEFILGQSPLHVMAGTSLKGVCRRYLDLNCKLDPLDKGVPGSRSESKRQSGEILIDVNFRDTIGLTALMYAVEMGDEDIVNMLLGAGADPNLQEELRGETALHMAARRGDSVSVIQMLLDANVDAGTRSYQMGWTALHIAAGNCNDKVVETLIAQMPVNTQDIEGREALGLMLSYILDSRNGSKGEWNQKEVSQRIIRMMVEANLDIDRPIPYGWSVDDLMALH